MNPVLPELIAFLKPFAGHSDFQRRNLILQELESTNHEGGTKKRRVRGVELVECVVHVLLLQAKFAYDEEHVLDQALRYMDIEIQIDTMERDR